MSGADLHVLEALEPQFPAGPRSVLEDVQAERDVGGGVAAGRWVRIAPTGRPQVYRDVAAVQSGLNPLGGC